MRWTPDRWLESFEASEPAFKPKVKTRAALEPVDGSYPPDLLDNESLIAPEDHTYLLATEEEKSQIDLINKTGGKPKSITFTEPVPKYTCLSHTHAPLHTGSGAGIVGGITATDSITFGERNASGKLLWESSYYVKNV